MIDMGGSGGLVYLKKWIKTKLRNKYKKSLFFAEINE